MDYSKIKIISLEGLDHSDFPRYCDAFIAEATYDGKPMTDEELEEVNSNFEFLQSVIHGHLY
tara:strand:+ start:784 stop:969 length:186 start_codon:yes stop_codon:yes gene_type:complete